MREIGSEFWLEPCSSYNSSNNSFEKLVDCGSDKSLLFSGRTAIDFVLEDITTPINKVYMPSYCCKSMLQPFIERNICIEFYDVVPDVNGLRYIIDFQKDIDIFFAMSYFGYHVTVMDSIIEKFTRKNILVIEDITHRLLSIPNHCRKSDYLVASLRKWFPIPSGGLAIKQRGTFQKINLISPPQNIINKKISAMRLKERFIKNSERYSNINSTIKNDFLKLFGSFNLDLERNYKKVRIDNFSKTCLHQLNIEDIRNKRLKNVSYISNVFHNSRYAKLLIQDINPNKDCPLFVPLIVKDNFRDSLKKYLIENNIFCPVHWPLTIHGMQIEGTAKLYSQELSLVCDQRYQQDDMERLVKILEEFVNSL